METTTLEADARRRNAVFFVDGTDQSNHGHLQLFDIGATAAGEKPGTVKLVDVPVFRSGTFRDSWGDQHTWEGLHLDQMVTHFNLLKQRGIFPNVPVRHGHPSIFGAGGEVIGYHESLRTEDRVNPVDGQTYTYLLATYEVIGVDNVDKVQMGLWRSRSAEIGAFVSNSEAEFWPVYQGVAYVDIPAVEGLVQFAKDNGLKQFSIMTDNEEAPVGDKTDNKGTETGTPTPAPPAPPAGTNPGEQTQHGTGQTPVPAAPPVQTPPFVFSIGGQSTSDFAAVQAHITTLETAAREQKEAARNEYCDTLATTGRIFASKLDETKAFAKGLTDEQFSAWRSSMEGAPAQSIFGQHGQGGEGTQQTQHGQAPKAATRIEILQGIVQQHAFSGMTQRQIEGTSSFKELQTLLAQQTGANGA